jgi:transposase
VLHTGIQWEYLLKELGFGSGMTCWRRLRDWNEVGVWQRLREVLLAELNAGSRLDWSRCVVDSSDVRALRERLITVQAVVAVMSVSIRQVGADSPVSPRDILLAIAQWIIARDLWGRAS